jgi:putative flippase GtrA
MIRRELGIFLVVGALTVMVDFLVYRGLVWTDLLSVDVAKAGGFLTGTVFAYFANRLWTFAQAQHSAGSARRFIALYTLTLAVNVAVNSVALVWLAGATAAIQIAFLLATGISATLNFLGMKLYVFKSAPTPETR